VGTVVARAPLRVSLGGGGTDLSSYYGEHEGFVVSAAIDRHVYVVLGTAFQPRYRLKHLEWEEVDEPGDVRHPILRAALERHWNGRPVELASVGDVPPGTGLGSSGAYTACVLKALALAAGSDPRPDELAESACELEIDVLGRKVGKQDQYAAAHGGVNALTFRPNGEVETRRLELPERVTQALRERFLLFFTGEQRSASKLLSEQVDRTEAGDPELARNLHRTKELARETCQALEGGDLARLSELMNLQWELKRDRLSGAATQRTEELRALALDSGATGLMLMGAGGGGFLLAYSESPDDTRAAMAGAGAEELGFDVDPHGCVGWAEPSMAGSPPWPDS
jgi:D-glycero-alpha-D-manno-heptose-7-phosphate kinase